MNSEILLQSRNDRRSFIGGSDARIIMGADEAPLMRLWREKRGEAEPENLSGNLVVQLGSATEDLNRNWYETQHGSHRYRHSAPRAPPRPQMDGGDPGRDSHRDR